MYLGEENTKKRKLVIRGISFLLAALFVIFFRKEIGDFFNALLLIAFNFLHGEFNIAKAIPPASAVSVWKVLFNCFGGFLFVFVTWMVLLAFQAILPVDGFVDAYRTAWHFLLYMLKLHGFAVFVKDGEILTTKEDNRDGPGVAVVDFNSAIVLEEKVPPPGLARLFFQILHWLLVRLGLADNTASPRAAGPGIVFTRRGEKIRGAVDLRKQFRMRGHVPAYTRDGIEVKARVWAIFSVGQEPDVLQVTYDGEPRPENLRVVNTEKISDEKVLIKGFVDELDRHDRDEIHHFIHVAQNSGLLKPYEPLPEPGTTPEYNDHRVFRAVFSQARDDKDELLPWTVLPVQTATAVFREIMLKVNYNDLYHVGQPVPLPIPMIKKRMGVEMRNSGLLSFRLLFLQNHQQILTRKDYLHSELVVSDVRPLTHSKLLRDHGIKIIMSNFGDIFPVNKDIYQHRLNVWKSTWQRETDFINAKYDLEAARIRNHAKAMAQQNLINSLNEILHDTTVTQEVMAVRILQSLESIASNTKTKDMLPGGTLDVMKTARDWLMSGDIPPTLAPPPIMPIDGDEL